MILFGPLIIPLPRGTLGWAAGFFLGAVVFAIGVMLVVSAAESEQAPANSTSRYSTTAVTGYRTCEPFCGAVSTGAAGVPRP
ncbi:hypothetical protein [Nocardia blacklockiae]|uniref:hypothetical protein n=1 Tax=Nocardia blacklockiae TaxID=480036 RepID=UPI0018956313|nr:hypothetical protein [Nocardia blacklockiae]MBF6172962.1 hypothetical protein [Nocardia blacklockiae]